MTTITLRNWQHAHSVLLKVSARIKERVMTGRAVVLTVEDETRSGAQNSLLHAMLTEISREREWAGKKRDVETWKRLLVAAWSRARGESIEVLPALDGHGIDVVFRRTSKMTKAEVAELIEFIDAWRATA